MQEEIASTPNLTVLEGSVDDLHVVDSTEGKEVKGVYMGELLYRWFWYDLNHLSYSVLAATGEEITGQCVVLTTGTFLRGRINIGLLIL